MQQYVTFSCGRCCTNVLHQSLKEKFHWVLFLNIFKNQLMAVAAVAESNTTKTGTHTGAFKSAHEYLWNAKLTCADFDLIPLFLEIFLIEKIA